MANQRKTEQAEALERGLHRLRTEGVLAAVDAAIALLRDPKSPAQARSATINAVFRASGYFDQADDGPAEDELTPAEIAQAITVLEAQAAALSAPGN